MMRKRVAQEMTKRCLGKLEHHGEFNPCNQSRRHSLRLLQSLCLWLSLRQTKPSAMPEYITYDTKVFKAIDFNLDDNFMEGDSESKVKNELEVENEPEVEKEIEKEIKKQDDKGNNVAVPMEIVDIMGKVEVHNEENMNEKESDKEKVNENERNGNEMNDSVNKNEDEFWENKFNEETFDKVLNEAAESFKQRKDLTRSKRNSMTPLTFSLGLVNSEVVPRANEVVSNYRRIRLYASKLRSMDPMIL
ncbi:hypothetical protein Tco_0576297, partial [Tanacetum coccineum]